MATAGPRELPRPTGLEHQTRAAVLQRVCTLLKDCERLLASLEEGSKSPPPIKALAKLKDRDIEFIHLVCNKANWTYLYIASRMKLTMPTLHRVRKKVFSALGVGSRIDLVRLVEHGGPGT